CLSLCGPKFPLHRASRPLLSRRTHRAAAYHWGHAGRARRLPGRRQLSTMRSNYAAGYRGSIFLFSPSTGEDQGGGEDPHTRPLTPHPDLPPQGGKEPRSNPSKLAVYFLQSVLSAYPNNHPTGCRNRRISCFDRLSTNGNPFTIAVPKPVRPELVEG